MKKYLKLLMIFSLVCITYAGYLNRNLEDIEFIEIKDIKELEKVLSSSQDKIVQIDLKNCPYCIELDKIEKSLKLDHKVRIYRIEIESKEEKGDMEFICNVFEDFKYFPSLYKVRENKVVSELDLTVWKNLRNKLKTWL